MSLKLPNNFTITQPYHAELNHIENYFIVSNEPSNQEHTTMMNIR
jgi:hypothetical protein